MPIAQLLKLNNSTLVNGINQQNVDGTILKPKKNGGGASGRFNLRNSQPPQQLGRESTSKKLTVDEKFPTIKCSNLAEEEPKYDWRKEHAKGIEAMRADRESFVLQKKFETCSISRKVKENNVSNGQTINSTWFLKSEQLYRTPDIVCVYMRFDLKTIE